MAAGCTGLWSSVVGRRELWSTGGEAASFAGAGAGMLEWQHGAARGGWMRRQPGDSKADGGGGPQQQAAHAGTSGSPLGTSRSRECSGARLPAAARGFPTPGQPPAGIPGPALLPPRSRVPHFAPAPAPAPGPVCRRRRGCPASATSMWESCCAACASTLPREPCRPA